MTGFNDKISNIAQLGGIETSVLDNGAGRGTRIAWVNTGAGLRFKVVIDRAMDIYDCTFNNTNVTWLSHTGITAPQPFSDGGLDWLRTFGGGLLTTCGLAHTGGPETDEFGSRGLHDEISNQVAEIESIIQPDPWAGKMDMSITGKIKQTKALGPNLELRRTITATLGKPGLRIHDEITNRGNTGAPHMLLYHFNFGWPLVDAGTQLLWQGTWQPREGNANKIFNDGNNFKLCPPPLYEHSGRGEEVAMIDIEHDANDQCTCGLYNAKLQLALSLTFNKKQLPWLINWQHWGKNEYVTGLEPSTNTLVGQAKAREQKELIFLQPFETRSYDLKIDVLADADTIGELLKKTS